MAFQIKGPLVQSLNLQSLNPSSSTGHHGRRDSLQGAAPLMPPSGNPSGSQMSAMLSGARIGPMSRGDNIAPHDKHGHVSPFIIKTSMKPPPAHASGGPRRLPKRTINIASNISNSNISNGLKVPPQPLQQPSSTQTNAASMTRQLSSEAINQKALA